jgi:hypothetical protein
MRPSPLAHREKQFFNPPTQQFEWSTAFGPQNLCVCSAKLAQMLAAGFSTKH